MFSVTCCADHRQLKRASVLAKTHARAVSHNRPLVKKNEIRLRKKLRIFFKQQAKLLKQFVLAHYADAYGTLPVDSQVTHAIVHALAGEDWSVVDDAAIAAITAVAVDGAKATTKLLKQDAHTATAVEFAKSWAADYIGVATEKLSKANNRKWADLKQSTLDMVQNEVESAIEDGATIAELAAALQDSAGFSATRAELIARTEMAKADSQGALASYRAVPSIVGKSWLAGDAEACEICLGNEEEGAIPIDQDFSSGDDAAPAHPNCECAIIPAFADEMDN
jgi:SPP1 gp7 family putative phage head morphogenesis protein